jgi:hypothetical protein
MTEAEWLSATDSTVMLEFLRGRASDRKLRLFAVSCVRCVLPPAPDEDMLAVLGVVEQVAEGGGTKHDLARARASLKVSHPERAARWSPLYTDHIRSVPAWHACRETAERAAREGSECCLWSVGRSYTNGLIEMAVPSWVVDEQAKCIRCVFGNPFRPTPSLAPAILSWNGGTVLKIALAIYDDRAFDRLPILADALEDAGCTDADILGHCRGGGEHTRGCWVVDLVLGKG